MTENTATSTAIDEAAPVTLTPGKDSLWVATVEHKHGSESWVCLTREGAYAALADFVRDWWDEEVSKGFEEGRECPEDDATAVEAYFDHVTDEFYSVSSSVLLP